MNQTSTPMCKDSYVNMLHWKSYLKTFIDENVCLFNLFNNKYKIRLCTYVKLWLGNQMMAQIVQWVFSVMEIKMQNEALQIQCSVKELVFLESFWTLRKDTVAKIKSKEISQRIFQTLTEAWVWLHMNVAADIMEFLGFFYFLYFRAFIFICNILLLHKDFI